MSHLTLLTYTKLHIALWSSVYPFSFFHTKFSGLKHFTQKEDITGKWGRPSPVSLSGSFSLWKACLRLHAMKWRITVFPHSNDVIQCSETASGLTEGKELPITEQTSTSAGDGGSCQHCCASASTRQRHCGYPYLFSTVTDEEPFMAQYEYTIFPSMGASRFSPFLSADPSVSWGWLFGSWNVAGIYLANMQHPAPEKGFRKAFLSYAISFSCCQALNIFFFPTLRPDLYS